MKKEEPVLDRNRLGCLQQLTDAMYHLREAHSYNYQDTNKEDYDIGDLMDKLAEVIAAKIEFYFGHTQRCSKGLPHPDDAEYLDFLAERHLKEIEEGD